MKNIEFRCTRDCVRTDCSGCAIYENELKDERRRMLIHEINSMYGPGSENNKKIAMEDAVKAYFDADIIATQKAYNEMYNIYGPDATLQRIIRQLKLLPAIDERIKEAMEFEIEKVIFNDPATIVLWKDGTKTVVKKGENDIFDPEKGLAMAISKKALGNKGNYYNKIKEWLPIDYMPVEKSYRIKIQDEAHELPIDPIGQSLLDMLEYSHEHCKSYLSENKYGDRYDTRLFFAGRNHKVVCAGDCYHVKNIKKQNALVYISLEQAIEGGCRPCKHCNGKHKEEK